MGIFWTPAPLALVLHSHLPSVSSFWPRNITGFPEHVGPEAAKPVTNKGDSLHIWKPGEMPAMGCASEKGWLKQLMFVFREVACWRGNYSTNQGIYVFSPYLGDPLHLSNQLETIFQAKWGNHPCQLFFVVFSLTPNNHWLLIATGGKTYCIPAQRNKDPSLWECQQCNEPTWNYRFFGSREFHEIPNLNNISSFIKWSDGHQWQRHTIHLQKP